MRFLILVASVLIAVSAVSVQDQWQDFKLKHGKSYKSIAEETRRFAIFQSNVQKIEQHNIKYENGESGYKMGINKFADKTIAELRAQLLAPNMTRPKSDKTFHASMVNAADVPDSIDWTEKGAVTEVKDQGDCGSCFAFSSTGAIEGAHFLKTNELINLSEQDVVDCTTSYGNGACDGGLSMYVYQYAKDHGLAKLSDYPYTGVQGSCQNNGIGYVFVDSYVDVSPDEDSLKAAVGSIGPISVSLYADDVFYYESGIFDDQSCGKELDHEIVMVGYGSENGKDYWRGKNSWGTGWGESGYVRFARNANDICGIADMSTYPIL